MCMHDPWGPNFWTWTHCDSQSAHKRRNVISPKLLLLQLQLQFVIKFKNLLWFIQFELIFNGMMLNTVEQSKITLVSKVQGEAVLPAASHLLLMAAVQLEETMNGSRFPGWVNLEMGQPCGSAGSNGSSNLVPMKYLLILFGGMSLVDISWPTNTSFFQRSGDHWGYQRNWQNWEITTILLYNNFIWRVSSVLSLKRVGPRGFPFPILLAPVICKAGPWSLHSVEGQLVQSQCRIECVGYRKKPGWYI